MLVTSQANVLESEFPLVSFTLTCGSYENASCEQTVAELATPTGSGFTVTVTVKGSPKQPPPVYAISSGWNANVESP